MLALERHSTSAAHWRPEQYDEVFSEVSPRRLALVTEGEGTDGEAGVQGFLVARAVESEWEIENIVGMDHPFHLHGFQFQVLDRDGVREPYVAWKDMLNMPKHSTARIIVRYDDYPGKWMFHCHILDHEDHGMMGVLEVKQ